MLLTIDIGNTSAAFGVFCKSRLVQTFRLPTRRPVPVTWLREQLRTHLASQAREAWEGAVLAGVVPDVQGTYVRVIEALLKKKVLVVNSDWPWPVRNCYRPPKAVGVDRLVNAAAAIREFGKPVLIVDFGTATTVDAVDASGNYRGGAILPGLELSALALAEHTALLPVVDLKRPVRFLGQNTRESIRVGIVAGSGGAVSYLIQNLKKVLGRSVPVIATGGLANLVLPFCPELRHVRPFLTLQGLQQLWADSREQAGGRI